MGKLSDAVWGFFIGDDPHPTYGIADRRDGLGDTRKQWLEKPDAEAALRRLSAVFPPSSVAEEITITIGELRERKTEILNRELSPDQAAEAIADAMGDLDRLLERLP